MFFNRFLLIDYSAPSMPSLRTRRVWHWPRRQTQRLRTGS